MLAGLCRKSCAVTGSGLLLWVLAAAPWLHEHSNQGHHHDNRAPLVHIHGATMAPGDPVLAAPDPEREIRFFDRVHVDRSVVPLTSGTVDVDRAPASTSLTRVVSSGPPRSHGPPGRVAFSLRSPPA